MKDEHKFIIFINVLNTDWLNYQWNEMKEFYV